MPRISSLALALIVVTAPLVCAQELTDAQFFGVWNGSAWTTVGKINYAYSANLAPVETAVKAGNYTSARSALLTYYQNRSSPIMPALTSGSRAISDLAVNRTFIGPAADRWVGEITVSSTTFSTLSLSTTDLTSVVSGSIKSGAVGFMLMGKNKPEGQIAEFYSRERASNRPTLEVIISGTTYTLIATKDTYIQGDQTTVQGGNQSLLVRGSGTVANGYDTGELRTYLVFDLSSLPQTPAPSSATLRLYGHNQTSGTKVLHVFYTGDTTWTETGTGARIWTNTLGNIYSWQNATGGVPWTAPTYSDAQFIHVVNRANYVTPLAYEYVANTSDTVYSGALFSLMAEFGADVPDGHPDQITSSSLDVGDRLSKWVIAYHNAKGSSALTAADNTAILKAFWGDANFLANPDNFTPGSNWGMIESNGLYRTVIYFPEFSSASFWRSIAETRLHYMITRNIFRDYSYGEAGLSYALGTVGTYASLKEIANLNSLSFNPVIDTHLIGLTYSIAHFSDSDGFLAQYGDTDFLDATGPVFKVGSLYNDVGLKWVGSLGSQGTAPSATSILYPSGLFATMRSAWAMDARWLFVNNGKATIHGHPDLLSFELFAFDRRLLVDPGRYGYSGSPISDWLITTTEAHNTVEIDDTAMSKSASSKVISDWRTNAGFDFFQGNHNGYSGFTSYRDILFVKPDYWIVSDTITSTSGTHNYDQLWHFLPDANLSTPNATTDRVTTAFATGANLQVVPADPASVTASLRSGYYSSAYGVASAANYIAYEKSGSGTMTFDTVLYPTAAGVSRNVTVTRLTTTPSVSAAVATALKIDTHSGGGGDLGYYYLSKETNPTTARTYDIYNYNGKLAYVQTTSGGTLKRALVAGGKTLKQNTTNVVNATSTIPTLHVEWNSTNLHVSGSELTASTSTSNGIAIYAPAATAVFLNGASVPYTRVGNDVYAVASQATAQTSFIKAPRISATASTALWSAANAIDDDAATSWSTTNQASQTGSQWISVDMGANYAVKKITLTPRNDGSGGSLGFPWDFTLQTSPNGTTWTDIPGQSHVRYPKPSAVAQDFFFSSPVTARYVRALSTTFSNDASGFYVQLAEVSPHYEITHASRYGAISLTALSGWEPTRIMDGSITTNYSSAAQALQTNTQWVGLDLGGSYAVNKILLVPRFASGTAYCFPIDFKLQSSMDGTTWTDVAGQSYVNYPNPTHNAGEIFTFGASVNARYFRLYATKLRTDGGASYYLQLAEMYAY